MGKYLVTGAAGFIGSHLSESLVSGGHQVIGIDSFTPFYSPQIKRSNITALLNSPNFAFHELDLRNLEQASLLSDVDTVVHLAALPGLLGWEHFEEYVSCNIIATQKLLEAVRANNIKHFVYGSTSSVYGREATKDESSPPAPSSPYGVTKLTAEHLCQAYSREHGMPLTILRFFSVYGPRQRPDMAYHIFISSLLKGEPITIYGDGEQSRSNTYISDCVRGIMLALEKEEKSRGEIFNIGGGEEVTLNRALDMLQELTGEKARIVHGKPRPGDQRRTAADIGKAKRILGYSPSTSFKEGLKAQVEWQRSLYSGDF